MLKHAEERRNRNASRSFNEDVRQLREKSYQIWLSRSIYFSNCTTTTHVVSTNDGNELWRQNKSSLLRKECKPCPLAEVDYTVQVHQKREFDRKCRAASASVVRSSRSGTCSASSIRSGLHGYLTGSRYNSAHHIDNHALKTLGVYIPRGYTHNSFNRSMGYKFASNESSINPQANPAINVLSNSYTRLHTVSPIAIEGAQNVHTCSGTIQHQLPSYSTISLSCLVNRYPSNVKVSKVPNQNHTEVLNTETLNSINHTLPVPEDGDSVLIHHYIDSPNDQQTEAPIIKLNGGIMNSDTKMSIFNAYMESHRQKANNGDTQIKNTCRQSTTSMNPKSATIIVDLSSLQMVEKEQDNEKDDVDVAGQGSHI